MSNEISTAELAAAIRAWERGRDPLDDSPFDAFRSAHRTEAHYLWLLANDYGPPRDVQPAALRRLVAWGLVTEDAIVTRLGERLLETARPALAPDPYATLDTDPRSRR